MKVLEFNQKKKFSEASGVCAVVSDDIVMELNEYGNYEEKVLLGAEEVLDSDVEFASPNLNSEVNETDIADRLFKADDISFDLRLGYYRSLYAGHVIEGDYRVRASSGGIGTWIFKELFEQDLIDGVIHVKENLNKDSPILFQYGISRSVEEIQAGSRSKYYPVEMSEVLRTVREVEGRYAIIGIPSFIMAVRLLCEKDEVFKSRIKYTVGLICGHQKSSKFGEFLAWQVGIKPGNLTYIDYRKKLMDRPADDYGVEMVGTIDGVKVNIVKPMSELLGHDWGEGFFKAMASDYTDDVFNETADITVGDAWLPEYSNDSLGSSVVIVRNAVLDDLIHVGVGSSRLKLDIIDKEAVFLSQASHYRHTHDELAYRLFKKEISGQWRPKKRVEASDEFLERRKKIQDLREEISASSHIVYKRAVELNDLNHFIIEMGKLSNKYKKLY